MGYEISVRGWFSVEAGGGTRLQDKAALAFAGQPAWSSHQRQWMFHVTGSARNHLVFATESKGDAYTYVRWLREIAASFPTGQGIVTASGECPCDRDRFFVVAGGKVMRVPVAEIYSRPWRNVAYACHDPAFMDHPINSNPLAELPREPVRVGGWVCFPLGSDEGVEAAAMELLKAQAPALSASAATMRAWGHPYLLLGEDDVDAGLTVRAVEEVTRRFDETRGVLYLAVDGGTRFQPVALDRGRHRLPDAVATTRPDGTAYPLWSGKNFTGLYEPEDAAEA